MPIHPVEIAKRVPWEVWVGLLLTIVVAWIATRQAVSAGQAQADKGQTLDGAKVAEPLPQEPIVDAISQQSKANTDALTGLADGFSMSQAQLATQQQAILSAVGQHPATASPSSSSYGSVGAAMGSAYQSAAVQPAPAAAATTRAEAPQQSRSAPAPSGGDIGTHSATDASGRTYTIDKAYGAMTDAEKDDANRFAHGYSG